MSDGQRGQNAESQTPGERGESVPLNWACTVCGYRVEGSPPQRCPDCGAGRAEFDEIPVPGF